MSKPKTPKPSPPVSLLGGDVPIVRNAVRCGVCGAAADRFANRFQCQSNPNHMGDLNVGIFDDLTPPNAQVSGGVNNP